MTALLPELPTTGFKFDNYQRNLFLAQKGFQVPKAKKTGTTIAGAVFNGGVVLGADNRATEGSIVAEKFCEKIHYMADNMYCCGAGTAADTIKVTDMISSRLELHRLNTGNIVPVACALRQTKQHLFRYQGYISAALVLGGVDDSGPHLYSIAPHGSSDNLPFTSMGSGSLAATSVLEDQWRVNMTMEECKKLIRDAIAAGTLNDLGSGGYVDLCTIYKEKDKVIANYQRAYDKTSIKGTRQGKYLYQKGTTDVLSVQVIPLQVEEVMTRQAGEGAEPMDIA